MENAHIESLRTLHPLEIRFLLHALGEFNGDTSVEFSSQYLEDTLEFNRGQANQVLSWLSSRAFISELRRTARTFYELTELGAQYQEHGTPAERIIRLLRAEGPQTLRNISKNLNVENKEVGSAFGKLSKLGLLKMSADKTVEFGTVDRNASEFGEVSKVHKDLALLRSLLDAARQNALCSDNLSAEEELVIETVAKKRGASQVAFRIVEREDVFYSLTAPGSQAASALKSAGISADDIGVLSPAMLKDGSWKGRQFRSYAIHVPPSRQYAGRRNPYSEYLDWVRDKLVALGFEEFDGPLVESEFWNSDALFMPQFHAARNIHDVYYVKNPTHAEFIEQPYLDNVAAAHEHGGDTGSRGWGYEFDRDFTRRLILRSQGTVMSAKTLHKARVPGKYFGILRCFRYDQVDATHLSDFYQTEGIVLSEQANLRTLLGLLEIFAVEIAGASDVRYVPGYFPFTEPSVEVHIKHPKLGWFELGGAGIFRPEVSRSMGVHVPVLAWGLGIDRMALMHLGLNDLRELFTPDIESVRLRRAKGV